MADTLLVSTRKGLFAVRRDGGGWRLGAPHFLGDNLSLALADARDGAWYAALNLGHFGVKLKRSLDRGASWQELALPAYPEGAEVAPADGKPPQAAALHGIWALAAGAASQPGRLWAGTLPGGLFRSDDAGASWQLMGALWDRPQRNKWFGGGFDTPGIHSICVDPREPRTLRIAISSGGVWTGYDDGARWECTSTGMYAEYMPPEGRYDPDIQDPHQMVQCAGAPDVFWVQHHNGVFRSTDGARNWQDVPAAAPSKFGFAVGVHPQDPDTAWFVPAIKDERRVPVDGALVVSRTRDGGRSFEVLRRGLPQHDAYDLVYRHGLAVHPGGEMIAIGSTTGGLWLSENGGDDWQTLSTHLPPIHALTFA